MNQSRGLRSKLSIYDDFCYLTEKELNLICNNLEVENDFNEKTRRGSENSSRTSPQP